MITKLVEVTQTVEVTVDESKFTKAFMSEFRKVFYDFKTLDQHLEHLAQMEARGLTDMPQICNRFIEGYGPVSDMGIAMRVIDTAMDVQN